MSQVEFEHHIFGIDVTVQADYSKGQREIVYSDNPQPGFDQEIEITSVFIGTTDIFMILNDEIIEDLTAEAWEHLPEE